jgi:hypothetical protein
MEGMMMMAPTANPGTVLGALASASIVCLWLATFHRKFFCSIFFTEKVTPYGIYIELPEALLHYWYLIKGIFLQNKRDALEAEVRDQFLVHLGETRRNVLITHSCRSIFYYIIKSLVDQAKSQNKDAIKIAISTVHFGSFYRLLQGMQKSLGCNIEFYEVDLKWNDWTLNEESINEEEFSKCDMVMCQHLFGVPFQQSKFFELGKKYNIPIVEDCVQSGSLFGKYKGNKDSDVVLYSGGLDKTPASFGAGYGFFRDSQHGNDFFEKCKKVHDSCPLDTWKARFIGCFNQTLHLMIAKNSFWINSLLGLVAYVLVSERGDYINWYKMSLKIRKNKSVTPFQHAESGFLRRPSVYHLMSMKHGLSKASQYKRIALQEISKRDLLLASIPVKYHSYLFPWLTKAVLDAHRDNLGISEFSWVYAPTKGGRSELCQFMNERFLIALISKLIREIIGVCPCFFALTRCTYLPPSIPPSSSVKYRRHNLGIPRSNQATCRKGNKRATCLLTQ